ncbi:MAG: MJ1255/VC2487 family glycosyltransferase [Patescibacteria group bacterium]
MARILYGVAGEGSGHSSRAKVIIEYLISKGHKVKVISYGKGYKNLNPYFDVEKIFGLHFTYKNNEIKYFQTLFNNLLKTDKARESIDKVLKITDYFNPQIVFSDFEPISCIVANIKKLPLISIDNQHRINNTKIEYPSKYKQSYLIAKAVTDLMVFNSEACLVTSFFKAPVTNKKTYIFPPILRKEIYKLRPKIEDYILVYFTSEFENIVEILKKINMRFVVYGFNKNKESNNLIFKKSSQEGFLRDLANCHGVIANAGFTLITEALYLKKPYLALPVKGQFEQVLNAYYLEKLGYGKYWDELNKERIESFLFNLEIYQKNLRKYKKEDNKKIFKMINKLIMRYSK